MADSFFLDPDEAKSLGNIEYMRTRKKVRKTYPATKAWGEGFAEEVEISATEKKAPIGDSLRQSEESKIFQEVKQEVTQRRNVSTDLDMFRNMAKNIRKS